MLVESPSSLDPEPPMLVFLFACNAEPDDVAIETDDTGIADAFLEASPEPLEIEGTERGISLCEDGAEADVNTEFAGLTITNVGSHSVELTVYDEAGFYDPEIVLPFVGAAPGERVGVLRSGRAAAVDIAIRIACNRDAVPERGDYDLTAVFGVQVCAETDGEVCTPGGLSTTFDVTVLFTL